MFSIPAKPVLAGALLLALSGCSTAIQNYEFNPKTCLHEEPQKVEGIQILRGPRTEKSILGDMQTAYCNGQVLLKRMNERGEQVEPGTIMFKITTEYTGEVISARVVQSDIQSQKFIRKITDMIIDSEFTPWQRHDPDAEFIYPMTFDRWWDNQ